MGSSIIRRCFSLRTNRRGPALGTFILLRMGQCTGAKLGLRARERFLKKVLVNTSAYWWNDPRDKPIEAVFAKAA